LKKQYRICIEFLLLNKKLIIIDKLIPKNDKYRFLKYLLAKVLKYKKIFLILQIFEIKQW